MKWFLNAYLQIGFGALTVTASELLMKTGASAQSGRIGVLGIAALQSGWTWLGIICYCVSFASWVHVLRTVPLGIAYGLINIVHVLIPIGCWLLLSEVITPQRWVGIALVLVGLLLIVKPLTTVEKKLEGVL